MISLYAALFWAGLWAGCWGWYYFTHSWHFGDDWSPVPPKEKREFVQPSPQWVWGETFTTARYSQAPGDNRPLGVFPGLKTREELRRELNIPDGIDIRQHVQEIDDAIRRAEEKKRAHDEGKDIPPLPSDPHDPIWR